MAQPNSYMAHTTHLSPAYQPIHITHPEPSYHSAPMTHHSSTYQFGTTHPSRAYLFAPMTNPSSAYESTPTTQNSPIYQHVSNTNLPVNQPAPTKTSMDRLRGCGKYKCFWEESEIQLLIEVLQEISCDPCWKTDGGFRSNYMNEVHRRILVKRPTFSKNVSPHIESKVKWLRKKFHIINDMLKQSGCQWNDVENKIACEKQWYDNYCQNHKDAKGLWDFQFPYLNRLESVYGRDRATGEVVEGYEMQWLML